MHRSLKLDKPLSDTIYLSKGLGILLVVIGHYNLGEKVHPEYWSQIRQVIYSFHMPLFMIVSGYLVGFSSLTVSNQKTYFTFVHKKAQRLLLPYFANSLLIFFAKYLGKIYVSPKRSLGNMWGKIIFDPAGGFAPHLWFLYALFLIFCIVPIMRFLLRSNLTVLLVAILLSFLTWPSSFCLDRVFLYLPYFVFGQIMFERLSLQALTLPMKLMVISLSIAVFYVAYITISNLQLHSPNLLLAVSGSIACIFIASVISQFKISVPLKILGVYSAIIYLIHTLAMAPMRIFFFKVLKLDISYFILIGFLVCCAGLIIPIVIEKWLIKPNPKIASIFLGVKD